MPFFFKTLALAGLMTVAGAAMTAQPTMAKQSFPVTAGGDRCVTVHLHGTGSQRAAEWQNICDQSYAITFTIIIGTDSREYHRTVPAVREDGEPGTYGWALSYAAENLGDWSVDM